MTLQELNEHIWYRGMKVVYVVSYLSLFAIGLLFVVDASRYHIPSRLPSSVTAAFEDTNFYLLSQAEMIRVLTAIDEDFANLPESEKQKAIAEISSTKWQNNHSKGRASFTYSARTEVSLPKAFLLVILCITATVAVMEFIRRCFYYIVIGQLFPRQDK